MAYKYNNRKKVVYAVFRGRKTGKYRSWAETQKLVKGYPGAKFKGYFTEAEADEAWADHLSSIEESEQAMDDNWELDLDDLLSLD